MKKFTKKYITILCIIVLFSFLSILTSTSWCADSTFAKIDYGGFLSVEIPRHWTFVDDNSKKNMNNFSEAVAKLNGINLNQGNNNILIAANAYNASSKFPAASLRVSVRPVESPTQKDMREFARYPESELQEVFNPIATQVKQAMRSIAGVKSYKIVDTKVVKNASVFCFYVQSQAELPSGIMIHQTYICPMGNKSVKLATSYKKSDKTQFKPVLDYVWSSLRVK